MKQNWLVRFWLAMFAQLLLPQIGQAQAVKVPRKITDISGLKAALDARPSKYKTLVSDDFNRANNTNIGSDIGGKAWVNTGGGFVISSKKLQLATGQTVAYGYIDSAQNVTRMDAEWTWEAGAATGSVVGIITGPVGTTPLFDAGTSYVHVICSRISVAVQIWSVNAATTLQTYYFAAPLAADSVTKYRLSYEIVGDTLYASLPDGNLISVQSSSFLTSVGRRGIWESLKPAATGYDEARFTRVAAHAIDSTQHFAPYATPQDVSQMLWAASPFKTGSVTFTPSATGWHRIATGGAIMSGICMISTMGANLNGAAIDHIFSYTANAYQTGAIFNLAPGAINVPAVQEARVSSGSGACYLDINVTATGTPIKIAIFGLNPGQLVPVVSSGATAGTNALSHFFYKNQIIFGSGSPVGVLAAPQGTLFIRTDGGAGATLYVKEIGGYTSTSGWAAK